MKKSKAGLYWLVLIIVLLYAPIAVSVVCSFNEGRMSSVWSGFSLKWYRTLFRDRAIMRSIGNSAILAAGSSLIAAVISTAAVLVFRKCGIKQVRLPLEKFTRGVSMIPMMVPDIIMGMSFLAFYRLLNLPFGMLTLLLAHVSFCIPYVFLQVYARAAAMDDSPAEAAALLGGGKLRVFFDITLPYLMPAELSGMIIAFAMSFDDVIISMFVTGVSVNTLPVMVYTQIKTGMTPEVNALCTVMLAVAGLCMAASQLIKKKYRGGSPQKEEL